MIWQKFFNSLNFRVKFHINASISLYRVNDKIRYWIHKTKIIESYVDFHISSDWALSNSLKSPDKFVNNVAHTWKYKYYGTANTFFILCCSKGLREYSIYNRELNRVKTFLIKFCRKSQNWIFGSHCIKE